MENQVSPARSRGEKEGEEEEEEEEKYKEKEKEEKEEEEAEEEEEKEKEEGERNIETLVLCQNRARAQCDFPRLERLGKRERARARLQTTPWGTGPGQHRSSWAIGQCPCRAIGLIEGFCSVSAASRGPEPKEQVSCCLLPTVAEPSSAASRGSFSPGQLWSKGRLKHSLYPEAPGFPWCLAALSLIARSLEEGRILEVQPWVPYPLTYICPGNDSSHHKANYPAPETGRNHAVTPFSSEEFQVTSAWVTQVCQPRSSSVLNWTVWGKAPVWLNLPEEVQALRTGMERRRKVKTGMKPQGPLSSEALLMAVDPQDPQEGTQLTLRSRSTGVTDLGSGQPWVPVEALAPRTPPWGEAVSCGVKSDGICFLVSGHPDWKIIVCTE
ncbi:hypothetical protein ACRRTK_007959 [Alexandromys fortis]